MLRDVTEQRARQDGLETYARSIIDAQEEERQRIARELHDSTLQSTILLYRQIDQLETKFGHTDDQLRDGLEETRELAEVIADELRHFSRDLRPSILDDLGLTAAVRWLVAEASKRTPISMYFDVSGDPHRLSDDVKLALFRVAQEALRNVERHAAAAHVMVRLHFDEDQVILSIEDDGIGFNVRSPDSSLALDGQLGLIGMHERARLLGGDVQVTSRPGIGTNVRAMLPIQIESNACQSSSEPVVL